MITYEDFQKCATTEDAKKGYIQTIISTHKASMAYSTARDAVEYYKYRNPTIARAQKFIYNQLGEAVPNRWAANNKIASHYYFYFVTQLVQYILGNGVTLKKPTNKEKLGVDFDYQMQLAATYAQNSGAAFLFFNVDHVDVFDFLEFAPLYSERTGALMAGVRFWQIDPSHPLWCTLYELDGFTEYAENSDGELETIAEKRTYKLTIRHSEADGDEIVDGSNYDGFPIVPLYNVNKQSELVGSKSTIDAYDLMASQLINNVDDGNIIYWVLKNMDGMDETDDAAFIQQLATTHVMHVDGSDGSDVDAHTVDIPFQASETALNQLRQQLFDDFMALDVSKIQAGNITATQIQAAYEPLNHKADLFEHSIFVAVAKILELAGINDTPTFQRSKIINQEEETQMVLMAAQYLDDDTIIRKLPFLSDDEKDEVIKSAKAESTSRFGFGKKQEDESEPESETAGGEE
jgi:Phage portal protein, SPP1 Gp6-like